MPAVIELIEGSWRGQKGFETAHALADAFVTHWDTHRAVLLVRNLAADEGDRRFQKVRREALRPVLDALARKIGEFQSDVHAYAAAAAIASILTYGHPSYPLNVFESNNAIPILYARGHLANLANRKIVACVGTRKIRPPYDALHERFARVACGLGFAIVSGFALGADTIGHRVALESGGSTICVMPGGLDRPFPPENRDLWEELLPYQGSVMVSEFGGTWWNPGQVEKEAWGYGDRPRTAEEFIARYGALVDALLGNPRMMGFCYTQLYDIEQEVNGLHTYAREAKFDPSVIRDINAARAAYEGRE